MPYLSIHLSIYLFFHLFSCYCTYLKNGANVYALDSEGVSPSSLAQAKRAYDKSSYSAQVLDMVVAVEQGLY